MVLFQVFKQCILQLDAAKDGNKEQKPVDSILFNLTMFTQLFISFHLCS